MVSGGILSTLFDCHGNWTAAIALMDDACLQRPAMTMTTRLEVSFKSPAPPNTELKIRSNVVEISKEQRVGEKQVVRVAMELTMAGPTPDKETLLATCIGHFKKMGALRVF